jgi:hypothetical protein
VRLGGGGGETHYPTVCEQFGVWQASGRLVVAAGHGRRGAIIVSAWGTRGAHRDVVERTTCPWTASWRPIRSVLVARECAVVRPGAAVCVHSVAAGRAAANICYSGRAQHRDKPALCLFACSPRRSAAVTAPGRVLVRC